MTLVAVRTEREDIGLLLGQWGLQNRVSIEEICRRVRFHHGIGGHRLDSVDTVDGSASFVLVSNQEETDESQNTDSNHNGQYGDYELKSMAIGRGTGCWLGIGKRPWRLEVFLSGNEVLLWTAGN